MNIVLRINSFIAKQEKVYIQPELGEKPPKGESLKRGPRGGVFYESKTDNSIVDKKNSKLLRQAQIIAKNPSKNVRLDWLDNHFPNKISDDIAELFANDRSGDIRSFIASGTTNRSLLYHFMQSGKDAGVSNAAKLSLIDLTNDKEELQKLAAFNDVWEEKIKRKIQEIEIDKRGGIAPNVQISDVTISDIRNSDLDDWREQLKEVFIPDNLHRNIEKSVDYLLRAIDSKKTTNKISLRDKNDDQLLAFANYSDPKDNKIYFEILGTSPNVTFGYGKWRKYRGVGTLMLYHMFKNMVANKEFELVWGHPSHKGAKEFYKTIGFEPLGRDSIQITRDKMLDFIKRFESSMQGAK